MRVASIIASDYHSARQQIHQAIPLADVIELRLDYWPSFNLKDIAQLRYEISLPVLFTLRKKDQGGQQDLPESERLKKIKELATLAPDYLDLEYDTAPDFIEELHTRFPTIQLIGSYHDFTATPQDLDTILKAIKHPAFDLVKIATYAQKLSDTLRLLIFLQQTSQHRRIIGMAMGEYGQASRILAPIVGSEFTYGCLDNTHSAAPGQLTLAELTHLYHVQTLNRDTAVYALLGDPVAHSRGPFLHNPLLIRWQKNAVYIRLKVSSEDLTTAWPLLKQLPFAGFSVTMPHKEKVGLLVDERCGEAQATGIVNTVQRKTTRYLGYNTDGLAAIDLLTQKTKLASLRVLILGAGGSAQAIGYSCLQQGAEVSFCNRTVSRAQRFTERWGGNLLDFQTLLGYSTLPFEIVINTLPTDAYDEQCQNWQLPQPKQGKPAIAMDIVYQATPALTAHEFQMDDSTMEATANPQYLTPFLQAATKAGWHCITGDKLFIHQALRQLQIWF